MLRIATRRSALARAQALHVGRLLSQRTGEPFALRPMATTGDQFPERAVSAFDAKGLFVDTTRQAVLAGDCDLVVHSFKDLPSDPVAGLALGAVPDRADPRDALVTRDGRPLSALDHTWVVGTSSERRRLMLLDAKPGLQVIGLRGNLDTRLRKVADGRLDAAVIALAGLARLVAPRERGGRGPLGVPVQLQALEPGECLPAPAQGALAVEHRADDDRVAAAVRAIDDAVLHRRVRAERALLAHLDAGCLSAVGALCRPGTDGTLELLGALGDPGRRRLVRRSLTGHADRPEDLGRELADDLTAALDRERTA